ncbi:MAG: NUDIX hydrolase [Lachnospiraceae bacterium]|nr:NUDIX hydrolase [Lachnospiraceae bacterium]
MKFKAIKKVFDGKYINRYDVVYETEDKKEKVYEIISREKNLTNQEELKGEKADSIVLILTNEEGDKLLVNKEFRLATGEWIYNFPAGLIDPGESPEEAARRELREETGLEICAIDDVLGISYSAIGFSNEKNLTFVGKAKGSFHKSSDTTEEIEPLWISKEEMRQLLKTKRFAARTQSFCYLWSKE